MHYVVSGGVNHSGECNMKNNTKWLKIRAKAYYISQITAIALFTGQVAAVAIKDAPWYILCLYTFSQILVIISFGHWCGKDYYERIDKLEELDELIKWKNENYPDGVTERSFSNADFQKMPSIIRKGIIEKMMDKQMEEINIERKMVH